MNNKTSVSIKVMNPFLKNLFFQTIHAFQDNFKLLFFKRPCEEEEKTNYRKGEKSANHIFNKVLIFGIYKEHSNLNIKQTHEQQNQKMDQSHEQTFQ